MRGRGVALFLALCVLLGGCFWLATTALDALASQERIEALAGSLWGGPVEIATVRAGWFPPRLRVLGLRAPGSATTEIGQREAAPAFEAAGIELRPDLSSLIFGSAPGFRSLALSAPVLRVALRDPFESAPVANADLAASRGGEPDRRPEVEEIRVAGGSVVLLGLPVPEAWRRIDEIGVKADSQANGFFRVTGEGVSEALGPVRFAGRVHPDGSLAGTFAAEKLELRIDSLASQGARFDLEGRLSLDEGGEVAIAGAVGRDATVDLRFDLQDVQIAPLRAFLAGAESLSGRATGPLLARGPLVRFDSLTADLVLDDARFRTPDVELEGRVVARVEFSGPATLPEGRFSLDARDARLRYRDIYRKAPETAASLRGELLVDSEGRLTLANWKLRVAEFRAEVR